MDACVCCCFRFPSRPTLLASHSFLSYHDESMPKSLCQLFSKEIFTFLGLTVLGLIILIKFVNLTPQVDQNFFFSSDDPHFQSEREISNLFVRNDSQLIINVEGPITQKIYTEKIGQLTDSLEQLPGVASVKSITSGPRNLKDAKKSPLWKRILIADDQQSTSLLVLIEDSAVESIIVPVELITEQYSQPNFHIRISGQPYIVELIKRSLMRDIKIFSSLAFVVMGVIIFIIFRSKAILLGTMLTCLNACIYTFMLIDVLDISIGILTANLATIIFVLTLSHVIFLSFNWQNEHQNNSDIDCVRAAVKITFPASFWSMITTLLGFLTLIYVPAKPLRELGMAGVIGAGVALLTCYGIYPSFLKLARAPQSSTANTDETSSINYKQMKSRARLLRRIFMVIFILSIPGLLMINTDPSMLSFFSKRGNIYAGLEYVDRNGGSSPLILVVESRDETLLNVQKSYERLWELQTALENHRSVGSVVSLPVLMAEAKQEALAIFLIWDWVLNILDKPKYGEIGKSFVTADRKNGLYFLRMNELNRNKSRLEIIDEITTLTESTGFTPRITGGVYQLQGHLSKLVVSSLIFGIGKLVFIFAGIAFLISRSWRIALSMTISIGAIPICILGLFGLLRIPVDVISSPASNIAIALGIDAMIHIVIAYRKRLQSAGTSQHLWNDIIKMMWKPILTSSFVIVCGFAIFFFSAFPPTQRFGIAIVVGSIIASVCALFVMPHLAKSVNK